MADRNALGKGETARKRHGYMENGAVSIVGPSHSAFSSADVPSSPSAGPIPSSDVSFSGKLASGPGSSQSPGPRIVLPPPYEGRDFTDPSTKQIVVVGVISRLEDEASQLLDRVLLAQVFSVSKCSSYWERKNRQAGKEEGSASGPNIKGEDEGTPASTLYPRGLQENGVVKGTIDVEGKKQALEVNDSLLHRTGDASQSNEYSASKAGDSQVDAQMAARSQESKDRSEKGSSEGNERERDWIDSKLKNYYDGEKGVLYVQYVWGSLPRDCMREGFRDGEGLAEALERHEADSFRGLLFMFSVCHIILIVQEGSRFDPRYLRIFRTLQAAKHALAPFVKSHVLPGVLPHPVSRPSQALRSDSTARDTQGRSGVGVSTGRQNSSVGFMSSQVPVLYPGQCTPVTLFVCLEESSDSATVPGSNTSVSVAEDATETSGSSSSLHTGPGSSLSPGSTQSRQSKSSQLNSGPGRPGSKIEASSRKKMQSSTEAQIRFLLKKCRTLASVAGEGGSVGSVGSSGIGMRSLAGGVSSFVGAGSGGALFALDQSRAVVFVDRAANRPGAGLEELSDMLSNLMRSVGKPSDQTLNLTGFTEPVAEDIQAIKDFLLRHIEILRGRGGITNTTSGSSAGAGMVAAAAAAAAASASGGTSGATKSLHNPPELPTVTAWFSACQLLVDALSSAWEARGNLKTDIVEPTTGEKSDLLKGQQSSPRKVVRRYSLMSGGTMNPNMTGGTSNLSVAARQRVSSLEGVITSLESAIDIDLKFSTAWCKRVLPSAYEIYLKDLPSSYPTFVHKAHLERALALFHSMVRGPAVPLFVERLIARCEAMWHSGRQLCDSVSLRGRPCIHHVHDSATFTIDTLPQVGNIGPVTQTKMQKRITKGTAVRVSKPHSSGVVFLHACACGRSRKLRKDPFNFESANISFFQFPNCEDMLPSLALPPSSAINVLGGSMWSLVRLGSARYYQPRSGVMQIGFIPEQKYLSPWNIVVVYESSTAAVTPLLKVDLNRKIHKAAVEPEQPRDIPRVLLSRPQIGSVDLNQGAQAEQILYSTVAEKGPPVDSSRMTTRVSGSRLDKGRDTESSFPKTSYGGDSAFPPLPQKTKKLQPVAPSKPLKVSGVQERLSSAAAEPVQEGNHAGSRGDKLETMSVVEESLTSLTIVAEKEEKESLLETVLGDGVPSSKIQHFQVYVGFEHECPHGHRFFLSVNHVQNLGISYPHPGPVTRESDQDATSRPDHRISPMMVKSVRTATNLGAGIESKSRGGLEAMSVMEGSGDGYSLLELDLPIFMRCPHCKDSDVSNNKRDGVTYAGCTSQLQRIFLVTPPVPLILASQAVVEFEGSPSSISSKQQVERMGISKVSVSAQGREKQGRVQSSVATEVVLPPDSFLVLRLPFIYHTIEKSGDCKPLIVQNDAPEHTAWLVKGTALRVLSKGTGAVAVGL